MNKFTELLGYPGRMISGSKSGYRERYPSNLVIFNANVCVNGEKVWFGDIDVTLSKDDLIELSISLKEDVYILYEMDGRFENEENPKIDRYVVKFNPDGTYELGKYIKNYYSL